MGASGCAPHSGTGVEAYMDRGRRYARTPMARRRFNARLVLFCLLAVGLIVGIAGLTLYFVQSGRNRAEQAELAAVHREGLQQEQAPAGSGSAALPTAVLATSAAGGQAQASSGTNTSVAAKPFFQVIGLTRKAFKPIVRRNADAVGWLTIDGVVDQPVVYRDNTFYLTHDIDRQSNACGAVFLDENHPLRADAQNLLLFGHNMKDESMFGKLPKYMKNGFLRTHYLATLETRFEVFSYLIFAVDRVSMDAGSDNFLYFWGYPSFAGEDAFRRYIDAVYDRSLYTRFLDVDASDTLLTLVTCVGEDRLVLLARRRRPSDTDASIQNALLGLYLR